MGSNHRSASIVSIAVMGSRVLGLVREMTFAALFGAGKHLDAFLGAFQIPNLLRDLFAEGALSTSFTTVFTKTWEKEGAPRAWHLANLVLTSLILVLGAICIIGIFASPQLVALTNYGFHEIPGKFELTVQLTQVLFPFILFVSIAAVVMGMLNARMIFGIPASASSAFNLVSIIGGVLLAYVFEPQSDWRHPHFGERGLIGVASGVLLGGLAQLAIQLPSLWRLGFRYTWSIDWNDPALRQVLQLMIPSIIAGAAVQVNVLVNGMFASHIDGGRSWLNCAFRLVQFPIGVFGVAIATVTLPAVARQHARQDLAAFGKTVEESLRFVFFLTIPSSLGLAMLATPIIALIYQHGHFTAQDTLQTSHALQAYVVGLAGYSAIKVLTPCFYALEDPRTPVRVSFIGMGLNLGLNLVLVKIFDLGHVGLAISTGFVAVMNFLQLIASMQSKIKIGDASQWLPYMIKVIGCATVSVWIGSLFYFQLHKHLPSSHLCEIIAVGGSVTFAGTAYLCFTTALKLPEADHLMNFIRKKTGA